MKLETQWIVGFVDGEGCFHIGIAKNAQFQLGYQVLPEFVVVQHERDIKILYGLKSFFGCGLVRSNNGKVWCYRVRGFDHLANIILPFFEKHQLQTMKKLDFLRFRKVINLMKTGDHLTVNGLEKIRKIKEFKIESSSIREE